MYSTTQFRLAIEKDHSQIWEAIQFAIEQRRLDGSTQWQKGYPNADTIHQDIEKKIGYVLFADDKLCAYAAISDQPDPNYTPIKGEWLTNGKYLVVHRIAISEAASGKGFASILFQEFEQLAAQLNISSIKMDTNFDNAIMLHLLNKFGYSHCGEVQISGEPRMAFEKQNISYP